MVSVTNIGKEVETQTFTSVSGEPGRIRTCDPLIISQLRNHINHCFPKIFFTLLDTTRCFCLVKILDYG